MNDCAEVLENEAIWKPIKINSISLILGQQSLILCVRTTMYKIFLMRSNIIMLKAFNLYRNMKDNMKNYSKK